MTCAKCNKSTNVTDSRSLRGGATIRRRRECPKCKGRFTTYEHREAVGSQGEIAVLEKCLGEIQLEIAAARAAISKAKRK
jgi:transcriptional regulator NrdR family protein